MRQAQGWSIRSTKDRVGVRGWCSGGRVFAEIVPVDSHKKGFPVNGAGEGDKQFRRGLASSNPRTQAANTRQIRADQNRHRATDRPRLGGHRGWAARPTATASKVFAIGCTKEKQTIVMF